MNYDRKALKLEAKKLIRETRPKVWVVTLIFVLLALVLPTLVKSVLNPIWTMLPQLYDSLADMFAAGKEPDELWALSVVGQVISNSVILLFFAVLFGLLSIVLTYGYKGYAIRVFLRRKTGMGDLFSGLPLAGRAIGAEIMCGIFIFLWTLLIQLAGGLLQGLSVKLLGDALGLDWLAGLVNTAVWCAAIILRILVTLRYCLTPYFIMTEDLGVFEAITASKQTMRGHYGKLLVLGLSFLGWEALVLLIIGAVALVGFVTVLFTAGMPWLQGMEEASHYVMTQEQYVVFSLRSMAELLRDIMVPMGGVLALAWLVALPLSLWLRAYTTVAEAGFFLTITGQVRVVNDEEEEEPVAVTTPASVTYNAPIAPDLPEVPTLPETPEPEAPALPETPQPEIPTPPETPQPETPEA